VFGAFMRCRVSPTTKLSAANGNVNKGAANTAEMQGYRPGGCDNVLPLPIASTFAIIMPGTLRSVAIPGYSVTLFVTLTRGETASIL
jgi:hypothetical protein